MARQQQQQGVLFDERFLDKHAGAIISDPAVAIVELVANSFDSWATRVDIVWPERVSCTPFSITDNGKGMSAVQFEKRWRKIDYNRVAEEGNNTEPPEEMKGHPPRHPYGRNGRGRHAAFRFGDPYVVRTWRDGTETTYEVRRGTTQPFDIKLTGARQDVPGHGTEIRSLNEDGIMMSAHEAREIIGSRFLADPTFTVTIDGTEVTFDDVSAMRLRESSLPVHPYGTAHLVMIDTVKADRTTRQHGVAWRVKKRLVGSQGWGVEQDRLLDGRTHEAKRFQFIVSADFLEEAVLPDWSGFDQNREAWQATRPIVYDEINEFLSEFTSEKRREAKETIKENLSRKVSQLSPVGRDRWNEFVDTVVDTCPSISTKEVEQVAGILANLELSTSKYGLVKRLHDMKPGDLDDLNQILIDRNVRNAKLALDEIQSRLKLIEELDRKLRDHTLDEVADLQPLFERSLWVFGPEFESIEFTSNRGMTEVIRKIFGKNRAGSKNRPDFVVLPDGSVGFYSRDSHDLGHEVDGVARLVIAEIKKVGVPIGSKEKGQPWEYVKELVEKGLLNKSAKVTCYVLGSKVDPNEIGDDTRGDGQVLIRPMAYDTFIKRAEARMLGLRNRLRDAPFLKEQGFDGEEFLRPSTPELDLRPREGSAAP